MIAVSAAQADEPLERGSHTRLGDRFRSADGALSVTVAGKKHCRQYYRCLYGYFAFIHAASYPKQRKHSKEKYNLFYFFHMYTSVKT